jgi:hypothetical protein
MAKAWGAILLALAVAMAAPGARGAYPNEPTGFRGIPWGTPVAEVRARVPIWFNRDVGGGLVEYRSRGDLGMNGIPLIYNFYQFYRGQFAAGIMAARARERDRMLAMLRARFGPPQGRHGRRGYYWLGAVTVIAFQCDWRSGSCSAAFESRALMDKWQKAQAAPAGHQDF